jgi:hypothetical protein
MRLGRAMNILIACEFSGTVRDAFRARGHNAWSCDLLPTAADPRWHLRADALQCALDPHWDMLIAFPPCTYLTCSAEWAYGDGPYHQKLKPATLRGAARRDARQDAVNFVKSLWNADIPRIAIENPVGVLSRQFGRPAQIVQPYLFGDDASKSTCLWLKGLPALRATDTVAPRMVDGRPRWANQTDSGQNRLSPSPDRASVRGITYPGIANAMALQWG